METKSETRKKILSSRKKLSDEVVAKNSFVICKKLLLADWYPRTNHILVYAAIQKEVDLTYFIKQALADGKQIYLPKVFGDTMEFFQVRALEELKEGAFGVPEPQEFHPRWQENKRENAVVIVPGVAFSIHGDRVGYGKGYYDRFLSLYPTLYSIGIAHKMQLVQNFHTDIHDKRMKQLITEKGEVIFDEFG